MSKSVQIPEELFNNLVLFFLANPESGDLFETCKQGVQAKFDKVVNRDLYSTMHDENLSSAEREQARQQYLDRRGIPAGFRWSEKTDNPC